METDFFSSDVVGFGQPCVALDFLEF